MNRLALLLCLGLAGCQTAEVQQRCAEAQDLLGVAGPVEASAPLEVRTALSLLRTGAVVCGSPQYAEVRNKVVVWLQTRTQRPVCIDSTTKQVYVGKDASCI